MPNQAAATSIAAQPGPASKVPRPAIGSLTGVRFFAAMAVVMFHFLRYPDAPIWLKNLVGAGGLGVPFFFVLSGFILAYNYLHGDALHVIHSQLRDKRGFWIARFARIYPAYLLALLLDVPFFLRSVHHLPAGGGRFVFDAIVIAAFTLTLTQNFALVSPMVNSFNAPAWSLSVEAFFYLLFPWIGRGLAAMSIGQSFLWIGVSLSWLAFVPAVVIPRLPPAGTFLGIHGTLQWAGHPLALLPMFIIGIAVCRIFVATRRMPQLVRLAPAICAALVLALLVALCADVQAHLGAGMLAVASAFFACLIFALAFDVGRLSRFLALPTILLLGEASYGIYILQAPVYGYFEQFCRKIMHRQEGLVSSFLFAAVLVGLAVSSHLWFETPVRRVIRRRFLNANQSASRAATPPSD